MLPSTILDSSRPCQTQPQNLPATLTIHYTRHMTSRAAKARMFDGQLDPFSAQNAQEIAQRWEDAQHEHQARVWDLWAGTIALLFTDEEIRTLQRLGFTSYNDLDALHQLGRARGLPKTRR